jgi:NAD(P)H-quinone oxidoreductase subunit 4L
MPIGLEHYLVLSAILFAIGLYGALVKKNAIVVLMCIEIMLSAVSITIVAFSRFITPEILLGQVFTIFIIVEAAAEATVALAIIISLYRRHKTIDVTKIRSMKG